MCGTSKIFEVDGRNSVKFRDTLTAESARSERTRGRGGGGGGANADSDSAEISADVFSPGPRIDSTEFLAHVFRGARKCARHPTLSASSD